MTEAGFSVLFFLKLNVAISQRDPVVIQRDFGAENHTKLREITVELSNCDIWADVSNVNISVFLQLSEITLPCDSDGFFENHLVICVDSRGFSYIFKVFI